MNVHVRLHDDHPSGCVARGPGIQDDDALVRVAVIAAQGRGIVTQGLRIRRAGLLQARSDDAPNISATAVDHLVVSEDRSLLIEQVQRVLRECPGKHVRITQLETDVGPIQHLLDGLSVGQAPRGIVIGGRLARAAERQNRPQSDNEFHRPHVSSPVRRALAVTNSTRSRARITITPKSGAKKTRAVPRYTNFGSTPRERTLARSWRGPCALPATTGISGPTRQTLYKSRLMFPTKLIVPIVGMASFTILLLTTLIAGLLKVLVPH